MWFIGLCLKLCVGIDAFGYVEEESCRTKCDLAPFIDKVFLVLWTKEITSLKQYFKL